MTSSGSCVGLISCNQYSFVLAWFAPVVRQKGIRSFMHSLIASNRCFFFS